MEDHGVIESAHKVFDEKTGSKRGRDEEKGNMGRLEKRPSGIVVSEQYNGDEMINGVKYEEEKKTSDGGFFSQLITNLVSSNSPRVNDQVKSGGFDAQVATEKAGSGGGGDGEGGGGIINNLISNIFHQNGDGGSGGGGGGGGGEKKNVEKDGGIMDNIASQLPRTLSEDAAPASDEASILIHSIIHD